MPILKLKDNEVKVEHDESITPKIVDQEKQNEATKIKNEQYQNGIQEMKNANANEVKVAALVKPLNDEIAKIEAEKAEATQKAANEAARAA